MDRIVNRLITASAAIAGSGLLAACNLYFPDSPNGSADGGHGFPDARPGHPDAGPRFPDAAVGYPDARPWTPDPGGGPGDLAQRWLAFDSDRGSFNRDIYLVRGDGSGLRRLTSDASVEMEPAFSHRGTTLAFTSDRSGSMQIHALDLATGAVTQLTFLADGADEPSWSADDTELVFHSGPSIYLIAAGGGKPTLLATGLDDFNAYRYPSLSLTGTEVIFSRNNEINARRLDTGAQRYVVQNWTVTEETPALSPDGRLVAFGVRCSTFEMIAVTPFSAYAPDPCQTEPVTTLGDGAARKPAWASNDALAFERAVNFDPQLSTAVISGTTAPGGLAFDIVGPPGDNRNPSWAPVGFQPSK